MALFPPPVLFEHPADLVIDVFGTFLGKRSERMIVRWRETDQTHTPNDTEIPTAPSGESGADSVPIPESLDNSSGVARDPVDQSGPRDVAIPSDPESVDGPADRLSVTTDASRLDTPESHDFSATVETDSGPTSDSPPPEQIVSQLMGIWRTENPLRDERPPSASVRLHEQLDQISETDVRPAPTGIWKERAVPMSRLRSVTVSGRGVTLSSDLINALIERGIALSFLGGRGQPIAQLSAPGLGGTVQTRRSQLAAYDSPLGVDLAVEFIRGKLRNQKHQLQYSGKYLKSTDMPRFERLLRKIKAIAAMRKQLVDFKADNLDQVRDKLMGYEGTSARLYWEGVAILLEGRVEFTGRITRGAIDPVNSALNYGYGILYGQVSAAILNAGLELYAGFLHVDRPGKPALVLDLVEEFRAPVVDRSVLAIVNQGIAIETDAHGLTTASRKMVADRVLERLSIAVPYEGKRWPLRTIIQNQARHLAVAVRGEREYRAFASRW